MKKEIMSYLLVITMGLCTILYVVIAAGCFFSILENLGLSTPTPQHISLSLFDGICFLMLSLYSILITMLYIKHIS